MQSPSLTHLEHIIGLAERGENRSVHLLRSLDNDQNWAFYVPSQFNEALDIKKTARIENGSAIEVWTQGANFAFKAGDVIYDHPDGYFTWKFALRSIKLCIQIKQGIDVAPATSSSRRQSGRVDFQILTPDPKNVALVHKSKHRLSQDDFVRFLISGAINSEQL